MSLTIPEQAKKLIDKSEKILLVAHTKMDGDTLSATIAMHLLLQKLGKTTVVTCADAVPEEFAFLPETDVMQREISAGSDFVISLDCSRTRAQKLRWKIEDEHLKIFVTPAGGQFAESDVTFFEHSDFDLILSLDAADRKQLGSIFEENTELFSRVPLIVFDHHASNPGFGTVNVIDTKAASTTEVIFHFLPVLLGVNWEKKIDSDIATLLLTGIITDTGSFQNPNTTPRSLEVAADLVELGARQQEIIRNIFKTKNIQTLKLWGRVLSKIKTDPIHRMLWSTVSADDLADTGGMIEDTGGIIDELLATAPGMEMVLLIKERPDGMITVSVRTTTPLCDATQFAAEFGGGGHTQAAGFKIRGSKPFDVVVGEVITAAQRFQSKRLRFPESDDQKTPPVKHEKPQGRFNEQQREASVGLPVTFLSDNVGQENEVSFGMGVPIELPSAATDGPSQFQERNTAADSNEETEPTTMSYDATVEERMEQGASTVPESEVNESPQQGDEEEVPSESVGGDFTPEDFSEMLERMMKNSPLQDASKKPPKGDSSSSFGQ